MLPGHPLANPRSRLSRIQHPKKSRNQGVNRPGQCIGDIRVPPKRTSSNPGQQLITILERRDREQSIGNDQISCSGMYLWCRERVRKIITPFQPHRLMQVLPGHHLAHPIEPIKQKVAGTNYGCTTCTSQYRPANTRICISQGSKLKKYLIGQNVFTSVPASLAERERQRSTTPSQPHKADSGAARTSPGRSQSLKQCASTQRRTSLRAVET